MFIRYSLWFKRLIHLKETYAHGSRWARKEETPLSKNFLQQPNYFSPLSLSVFNIDRIGGRGFNMLKPNSSGGKKEIQIVVFSATHLACSHRRRKLWDILSLHGGAMLSAQSSSLYALFFMSHILPVAKVPCRSLLSHVNPISSNSHTAYCEDVWKRLIQFACFFCGK